MHKLLKYKYVFVFIVFISGVIGIILELLRAYNSSNFSETTLITSFYFTTQSNFLMTIISLFFLLKLNKKHWFKYWIFIGLINILITAIVFHLLLTPYMENIEYIHHHLHTINPLLFLIFYFFFYTGKLSFKKAWISLIYPFFYMVSVYTIIEPLFGNLLSTVIINLESARFVYPFLDPNQYARNWLGLSLFLSVIIVPSLLIFSYFILWIKLKYDSYFVHNITKKPITFD